MQNVTSRHFNGHRHPHGVPAVAVAGGGRVATAGGTAAAAAGPGWGRQGLPAGAALYPRYVTV